LQAIVTKLVETKLMQLLRFKFGEVYTVNVSTFFGAEAPSHKGERMYMLCAAADHVVSEGPLVPTKSVLIVKE
jgi:hypothetical protein